MRDHGKILGGLFVAWALAQAVGAVLMAVTGRADVAWPAVAVLATLAIVAAYAYVGARLIARDPRMRMPAIVLSALLLISFPVGTALGLYGLWTQFRRPAEARTRA